ncbi:phosphocholine cytidylyltransferase family protein [Pseudomonas chlororaphis]|uniref:phosphocholine cytidylyltransferase family protein n=1 Tax=Pseudomonas chlororaphis TaxID=587753 RepID=UPI000F55D9EA|nr:phosphocholine cytidylyltransferase family protein [Pseudomonas chlororaphis]AZC53981.1 Putative sugar nucleotidyltransferase [Pseudomonas chlororaphis subsp. piscium]AZC60310.1 Putative sugar nucleotidyltransferase [Pseudomonas chlororaphis subsp. piscium]AZC72716.1 Putative sugar nucleotidyltransferase [Pseudomonas chlororaphis subsp. piscium]AZC78931.1 Putative sugar nucleotidyltransferase [Pseudomonas chlororaphis subsp. piscium]AZC85262.1 Putative sugar nucleotidyltransferase [Pseudomo
MKAVILAAGRGSRLKDLTAAQPKPLARLAGKPLLEWQLQALENAGVDEVHLVSGYCSEALEGYGQSRLYNPHWASSNMVRSLMRADALLSSEPTLVCYGDIVYRPDIVRDLMASQAALSITYDLDWWDLWSARFDDPLSDAESFHQQAGQLLGIGERVASREEIEGQYMGLLKFTPAGWRQVQALLSGMNDPQIDKLDMTSLLRALLQAGTAIATVAIRGGWVEVDNQSDIALYEQRIAQPGWSHDWRG